VVLLSAVPGPLGVAVAVAVAVAVVGGGLVNMT